MTSLETAVHTLVDIALHPNPDPATLHSQAVSAFHQLSEAIAYSENQGTSSAQINSTIQPARHILSQSPFIHRLQTWPRNIPGDFETVEYMCNGINQAEPHTFAHAIESHILTSPPIQQHLNKLNFQSHHIAQTLHQYQCPHILSVACGGSRDFLYMGGNKLLFN